MIPTRPVVWLSSFASRPEANAAQTEVAFRNRANSALGLLLVGLTLLYAGGVARAGVYSVSVASNADNDNDGDSGSSATYVSRRVHSGQAGGCSSTASDAVADGQAGAGRAALFAKATFLHPGQCGGGNAGAIVEVSATFSDIIITCDDPLINSCQARINVFFGGGVSTSGQDLCGSQLVPAAGINVLSPAGSGSMSMSDGNPQQQNGTLGGVSPLMTFPVNSPITIQFFMSSNCRVQTCGPCCEQFFYHDARAFGTISFSATPFLFEESFGPGPNFTVNSVEAHIIDNQWTPTNDGMDLDNDGVMDAVDNCPSLANSNQADTDSDGVGNVCDACPTSFNPLQEDGDGDGDADACDNCPSTVNPLQEDADSDGDGNVCDNCPNASNPLQEDDDSDGVGNVCDNCPFGFNPGQEDADADNIGDICDGVVTWTNLNGGNWDVASNWSTGAPPATDSTVVIPPGAGTVNYNIGALSIHILTSNRPLSLTTGSLSITQGASLSQTLTVSAGSHHINGSTTLNGLVINGGTINFDSGTPIPIGMLTMAGGTLDGSDTINVTGLFNWTAGNLKGAGVLNANGGITLGNSGTKALYQRILNNAGLATFSDESGLYIDGATGSWNNLSGSTFEIQNAASIRFGWFVGTPGTFNNMSGATLRKTGSGQAYSNIPINNSGLVDIQTGSLSFNGGGIHTGNFQGAGVLSLGGGSHVFQSSSSITCAAVHFAGGTSSIHGIFNLSGGGASCNAGTATFFADATVGNVGSLSVGGSGTINFNSGEAIVISALTLSGGAIDGSDTINVTGLFNWNNGNLKGAGVLNVNGGITLGNSGTKVLYQRTLNNAGVATYSGDGGLYIDQPAVWNNLSGSTFEIQNTNAIAFGWLFGAPGTFNNQSGATLRKTSSGQTDVNIAVNNSGVVDIQAGVLSLNGGGTHGGSFQGTALRMAGGTHNFPETSSITCSSVSFAGGASNIHGIFNLAGGGVSSNAGTAAFFSDANVGNVGPLSFSGSGTIHFNSGETIAVPTLTMTGGTLDGTDTMNVAGLFNWTNGTVRGTGELNANGGVTVGNGIHALYQRTLNNAGLATLSGDGGIYIDQPATWNNLSGSTFELQNSNPLTYGWFVSSPGTFNNLAGATLRKASSGQTDVNIGFNNAGLVDVQTGTLSLNGSFSNFAGTTLTGGMFDISGTLRFNNANVVSNSANILLRGVNSSIQNQSGTNGLAHFAANSALGNFTILNGRNFSRPSASFTNSGSLTIGIGSMFDVTTVTNTGLIAGGGTIDADVSDNGGTISPGPSSGQLTVTGSFEQSSGSTLNIEKGGPTPGNGAGHYDQLVIGGSAALAGTLNVSLIDGYQPGPGTTFDVLTASNVSGTFGSTNLPLPFGGNCKGSPEYGPDYVRLTTLEGSVFVQQPPSTSATCVGGSVNLCVTVDGTGPFTYQWRKNGANIDGAISNCYDISSTTLDDAGAYDVVVSNVCGAEVSATGTLSVFASGGGDINGDSLFNGADAQGFVNAMLGGPASAGQCAADMDADGDIDAVDLENFLTLLLGA